MYLEGKVWYRALLVVVADINKFLWTPHETSCALCLDSEDGGSNLYSLPYCFLVHSGSIWPLHICMSLTSRHCYKYMPLFCETRSVQVTHNVYRLHLLCSFIMALFLLYFRNNITLQKWKKKHSILKVFWCLRRNLAWSKLRIVISGTCYQKKGRWKRVLPYQFWAFHSGKNCLCRWKQGRRHDGGFKC